MKLIIATIHPDMRDTVQVAIEPNAAPLIFSADVLDLRDTTTQWFRGSPYEEPRMKTRLEILVANDMLVEEIVSAILAVTAKQGETTPGKGNIIVIPIDQWIPIADAEPRFTRRAAAWRRSCITSKEV